MKSKNVWALNINYEPIDTDPNITSTGTNIHKVYSNLEDAVFNRDLLKEKFLEIITQEAIIKFKDCKDANKLVQQYKYISDVNSRLDIYIEEVEYLENFNNINNLKSEDNFAFAVTSLYNEKDGDPILASVVDGYHIHRVCPTVIITETFVKDLEEKILSNIIQKAVDKYIFSEPNSDYAILKAQYEFINDLKSRITVNVKRVETDF